MGSKKRKYGFSLVELSFVIAIAVILAGLVAGGGTYLTNQALVKHSVEQARAYLVALKRYEAVMAQSGGMPYPQPATNNDFSTFYAKYKDINAASTNKGVFNEVNWVPAQVVSVTPGNAPTGYGLANYPSCCAGGLIYYFYKSGAVANASPIQIYDRIASGASPRYFHYYAVQVIDEKGYPAFTDGH